MNFFKTLKQTFHSTGKSVFKMYNYLLPKLLFLLFLGISTLFLYYSGIGCMWKYFLNIPCPGCGMTRAYIALLKGDIASAFGFHSMFWSVPVVLVYFFFGNKLLLKPVHKIILSLIAIGFLVNWIIFNLFI